MFEFLKLLHSQEWFHCIGNALGVFDFFINGDWAPPVGQTHVF